MSPRSRPRLGAGEGGYAVPEVKRYCWGHHGMDAYKVGKYVLYADAVKMAREAWVESAYRHSDIWTGELREDAETEALEEYPDG
jgi:hypothetical protein